MPRWIPSSLICTLASVVSGSACVRLPPANVEPDATEPGAPVYVETEPGTSDPERKKTPTTAPLPTPTNDDEARLLDAKQLFALGLEAYEAADYATALLRFEDAYALAPLPALAFNIAKTHEQLGDFTSACARYRVVIATAPAGDGSRQASEARVRALGC